jgi:hypothetical protein
MEKRDWRQLNVSILFQFASCCKPQREKKIMDNKDTVAMPKEFRIKDCALLAIATGFRATTLKELRDILLTISEDSLYYHFWGGLLQPRFEEREYNNDFAAWAWYSLHDSTLAERLAVIDPTGLESLEDLRQELLEIVEDRLDEEEYIPWMLASDAFEFIRSQIVVFDTRKKVSTPGELAVVLPELSTSSIFYHFIDAGRRHLDKQRDDFSLWLRCFPERHEELCNKLVAIDPYFCSLSQLKAILVNIFHEEFSREGTE